MVDSRFFGTVATVAICLVAALASLIRMALASPIFLTSQLWAEDGYFPLCARSRGSWSCLWEPYAGYLLFVPRVLGQAVAWLPIADWATAANVVAAIVAAVCCGLAFGILRSAGVRTGFSVLIALLPVLAPIIGFEAVNVYSSAYMPMLFVMALAVTLPGQRPHPWWIGVGLLLTAMTIPTAVVLILPVMLMAARRRTTIRDAVIMLGLLIVGVLIQAIVMITAPHDRPFGFNPEDVVAWAQNTPTALFSSWPGLSFGEATLFGAFPTTPSPITGWVICAAWLIGSFGLMARGDDRASSIGTLLFIGLFVSAVPALTWYSSNRYFVVPVLLALASLFLALDVWLAPRSHWVPWLVAAMCGVLWWSALPASPFRAITMPVWADAVARIQESCTDPGAMVEIRFSPDWVPARPDGTSLGLTNVRCFSLR